MDATYEEVVDWVEEMDRIDSSFPSNEARFRIIPPSAKPTNGLRCRYDGGGAADGGATGSQRSWRH